ncbi:hypothetical protein GoPhGRU1p47 [Gordonia phage GRU1]|uniref:Uncharacterized protein n=1 Tax=Gordonia phage GRU1 TaxID=1109710 RepID=G8EK06_9CAUD|nr:hypothetical protein GoPhGRU1p47 [Gordonia phage GRU1]AET09888.1 hypothetical protein [Gordonia phage GRU1]
MIQNQPKVVVHYQFVDDEGVPLSSSMARYDYVGIGFRVPMIGEHLRRYGNLWKVVGVEWDIDGPAYEQQARVTAVSV